MTLDEIDLLGTGFTSKKSLSTLIKVSATALSYDDGLDHPYDHDVPNI